MLVRLVFSVVAKLPNLKKVLRSPQFWHSLPYRTMIKLGYLLFLTRSSFSYLQKRAKPIFYESSENSSFFLTLRTLHRKQVSTKRSLLFLVILKRKPSSLFYLTF